jgi:hypothetical protein
MLLLKTFCAAHYQYQLADLCPNHGYLFGSVLRIRDPVPFAPWNRDPGWVKNPGSRSGMDIPDHIWESLEIFWVKILKFFDSDPDPRSGTFLTMDPRTG